MSLIPATILTGFLGSGKTTLLKRVLERGARPEDRRDRERVRRGEHRQRHPGDRHQGADHPDEQRLHLLHHPRGPARHAAAAGRQEAQGPARFRPRGDRDHRPGRPRPGGADLLHGRRDRRDLPARLHPHAGGRQARGPAAQRPAGGAPPGGLRRPDLHQQDRPGRQGRNRRADPPPEAHEPARAAARRCISARWRLRRCSTCAASTSTPSSTSTRTS